MQGEAGWVKRHDDIGDSRTKNIGPGGPGVEDTSETAQRMRGLRKIERGRIQVEGASSG